MYHVASFFSLSYQLTFNFAQDLYSTTKDVFFDHELPPGRAAMSAIRHPYAMCIVPMLS